MTWDYYYQGFPPDLDARYEAARTKAERAFIAVKAGRSRVEQRRLLIDMRIIPDVIQWAHCACELARRGGLQVGLIERYVDEHLRDVSRRLGPDTDAERASFVREVVERVTTSPGWLGYLAERQAVAELLATSDSASSSPSAQREVERTDIPSLGQQLKTLMEEVPISTLDFSAATAQPVRKIAAIHSRTIERHRNDEPMGSGSIRRYQETLTELLGRKITFVRPIAAPRRRRTGKIPAKRR